MYRRKTYSKRRLLELITSVSKAAIAKTLQAF